MARLQAVVYNFRLPGEKEEAPNPLADPVEWYWGAFENGKLLSAMIDFRYLMRFDGSSVPMSGIGGVGTLPEARGRGLIQAIFEKLIPEIYDRAVVFSTLTPFSHAYYRKFGYELACTWNNVSIPTGEFSRHSLQGSFTQVFPGDDTSVLSDIHKRYIADINHGICRDYWPDNRAWKIFTKDDPYTTGTFIYIWRNEEGTPKSYIKYQDTLVEKDIHDMTVNELVFIDREGLYGALGIVSGLSSQFRKFKWPAPLFIDPTEIVANSNEIKQELFLRDMTRVVNVKTALEKMRRPRGEGAYIIEVDDAVLDLNSGRYLVEYGSEGSSVSSTRGKPDMRCDIPALSQLVTGYRTLENALRSKRSGLEVYGNREILDKVFTLRPQQLTENF